MNWLGRLLNRRRLDAELAKELDDHVNRQTAAYLEQGFTEEEARRKARLSFGGSGQIEEACLDARGTLWVERLLQDLRISLRLLRKSPVFTLTAIGTLALGIGANTAIFRLFDAVRLSVLPIPNPQQLAMVELADDTGSRGSRLSPYPALTNPVWERFRDTQQTFPAVMAWANSDFNIATSGENRFVRGLYVSGDFFRVLEVQPAMGRVFTIASDHRGCGLPGAVISHAFWQREFGGDPAILGRRLNLNYQRAEIIGVTAAGFTGLEVGRSFDVAVPICSQPVLQPIRSYLDGGTIWWLTMMGRMKPGQTLPSAGAQLRTMSPALFAASLPSNYPAENVKDYLKFKLTATPGGSGVSVLREQYSEPLLLLLATAGLVLLIACANLANLSLARSSARTHEFAVRLAIGASRGRLIQQLLTEGAVLAACGALLGLLLSMVMSRVLISSLGTEGAAPFVDTQLNGHMLAFTAGVACLTCILFGLTPAFQSTRSGAAEAMKTNGRTMSSGRERFGIRQILVVTQVALSLVLIVGALLFSGSLRNLLAVDAGFQQNGILVANIDFSRVSLPATERTAYKRNLMEQIQAIPGIASAAQVRFLPLSGGSNNNAVWLPNTSTPERHDVFFNSASNDYLRTMGVGLLSGRDFNEGDNVSSPRVAIVNQSFVRLLHLGANPIGSHFSRQPTPREPETSFEIVGVVKDTKYRSLRDESTPVAFLPIMQDPDPDPSMQAVIRSTSSLSGIASAIRSTAGQSSPRINVDFQVFGAVIQEGLRRDRLLAALSGFFGALAALIAAVGLYGVMSYVVVRRTSEIGLRMALGAGRGNILSLILRQAGLLLAIGLVVGTLLSLGVTGAAKSMLFGLKPHDPGSMLFGAALLTAITVAATYLPARRAAKLEPMKALREE